MPPFGNLYELPVYVDQSPSEEPVIFFPAGSHPEVIEMRYGDFDRIVRPIAGHFALEPLKRVSGA
jgi:Ala-tRNA(Pro) deacylase